MADLKQGDIVKVYNYTTDGREIFEGKAKLLGHIQQAHNDHQRWNVEFQDELGTKYARWVSPEDVVQGRV